MVTQPVAALPPSIRLLIHVVSNVRRIKNTYIHEIVLRVARDDMNEWCEGLAPEPDERASRRVEGASVVAVSQHILFTHIYIRMLWIRTLIN